MKALVLAAGFGTRLRPWTDELAKPLIPVAGVEALFYALFRLKKLGIREAFVNAHYKSEQIGAALKTFQASFPELKLSLSYEKEILGTGGAILKLLEEQDFPRGLLVLNGDTLSSFDCRLMLNSTRSTFAASYEPKFFERYKSISIQPEGFWSKEKTDRAAHFLGAHFLHAEDLRLLKNKNLPVREVDLFTGIYEHLQEESRAPRAQEVLADGEDFWFDLNTKEFFLDAKKQLAGPYFSQWQPVLELRHPALAREAALNFWPLSVGSDK